MAASQLIFAVTNDLSHDQRMIRICSSLHSAGYDVLLLGRKKPTSKGLVGRNFRQHRLSTIFHQGKLFYLEYNIRLFFFLLMQSKPAAYSSVDLDTVGAMGACARLRRVPLIFDAHEYFWETPEVSRRSSIQAIWKTWANLWVPKAKLAYTVAPQLAQVLAAHHGIPFHIVRNLPYAVAPSPVQKPRLFTLLYQGMLNEGRGLEAMITAMPNIPKAQLWLVGEGDVSDSLRQLVAELKLTDRVKFWGMKTPEELPAFTKQAHLGLNLLENRSKSYFYSLANKCFDYMQVGLPAMHMDFPEYADLQQAHNAFILVEKLDPIVIAKHVNAVIDDPKRLADLKANNLKAAKDLTWEKEAAHLIDLYQSILG